MGAPPMKLVHDMDFNPKPKFGPVTIRNRGRLPHWETDGGCYFVTFRLHDSLPSTAIEGLKAIVASKLTPLEQARASFATLERYLDSGTGTCLFQNDDLAASVRDVLRARHGTEYRLFAWCIMPNHIHVCARLLPGFEHKNIVQGWKSVSAHRINTALDRTGSVWMREYYDPLVRDENELLRTIRYIDQNPVRAGIRDWKWVEVLVLESTDEASMHTAGEAPALRNPGSTP